MWSEWGRARVSKCRRLDEAPGFSVMGQQRLHLAAQVFIPSAGFLKHCGPAAILGLQNLVEDTLDPPPAFRFHLSCHSFHEEARLSRVSNPASQFRVKLSTLPQFPPRSSRQRNASRRLGSCVRPPSPDVSEHHPRPPNRRSAQGRPLEPHLARPVARRFRAYATAS